jgi:hypothetical protein
MGASPNSELCGSGSRKRFGPGAGSANFTLSSVRSLDTPRAIEGLILLEYLICMRATDVNSALRGPRDRDEECL